MNNNKNNQQPFTLKPDTSQTPLLPKKKFPLVKILVWLIILFLVLLVGFALWFYYFKGLTKEKEEIISPGLQEIDFYKDLPQLPAFSPSEVIVQFSPQAKKEQIDALLKEQGFFIKEEVKEAGFVILGLPENKDVIEAIDYLKKSSLIQEVEPDYYVRINSVPNDVFYKYQWNLHSTAGGINIEEIWDKTSTADASSVLIAVIDTGVAYENYAGFKKGTDFQNISFVPGYDFINNDFHANDDNGHGTFITSIIGSSSNNKRAISGINLKTKIMPVKVLGKDGKGTVSQLVKGIYYAVNHGAKVLNISIGTDYPSSTLENALLNAKEKGAIAVAACGNDSKSGWCDYPAAYDNYVIPVSAITYGGKLASYSNHKYGVVYAPGGDMEYDRNADGLKDGIIGQAAKPGIYGLAQGTSFAAPHITALVALGLSIKPDLTLEELKEIFKSSTITDESDSSQPALVNFPLFIDNIQRGKGWGVPDWSTTINIEPNPSVSQEKKECSTESPPWKCNAKLHPAPDDPSMSRYAIIDFYVSYASLYSLYGPPGWQIKDPDGESVSCFPVFSATEAHCWVFPIKKGKYTAIGSNTKGPPEIFECSIEYDLEPYPRPFDPYSSWRSEP